MSVVARQMEACVMLFYTYVHNQYMSQYTCRDVNALPLSAILPTCGTSYVPASGNKLLRTSVKLIQITVIY